jgi:HAE1 family hydrophobic/amphiphilic exporter-1
MPTPPTMRKVNPAESSILQITVTSPTLPLSTVDEYAETIIVRSISTIDGVANVEIYGQAHPAIRIQVDPNALAARGIGIDQVASAVRSANVNLATGTLDGPSRASIIQADGQLTNAAAYMPQIIAIMTARPGSRMWKGDRQRREPLAVGTGNGKARHLGQPSAGR